MYRHRARGRHGDGVTVGCGMRGDFHADNAAGAATIIEHHGLAQPFGEFLRDEASDNGCAAARRKRIDQPNGFVWVDCL